jgi:hypothetical protein
MDVNKIQIRKDGFIDKQLVVPIQLTWDYLGLDQSIDEYEADIIKQVTGKYGDFEVTRFAHAPIKINDPYSNIPFEPTDIQYEFNFFSGGSLSASTSWKNNYITEGFTPEEIFYYTNNFSNSFFKLDLYDNVDEIIDEIYDDFEKELKQGQDNYNKLWNMYSELKKENKELKALLPTDIDTANVWTWKKKENK